jgi:hypothetical protein
MSVFAALKSSLMKPNLNKITIHPPVFCLRTRRFGDWILSPIDNVQNVIVINLCNMCNVSVLFV